MGTPAKDPRSIIVNVRLTEKEYATLRNDMEKNDYLSVSKYIRERTLDKFIEVKRTAKSYTDKGLRDRLNDITCRINCLGIDYNHETKRFNSMCKMTRPDGSPVIEARSANAYLIKLLKLTEKIRKEMDLAVETVEAVEKDVKRRRASSANSVAP